MSVKGIAISLIFDWPVLAWASTGCFVFVFAMMLRLVAWAEEANRGKKERLDKKSREADGFG